jgi:hypothetical protein
MCSKAVLSVFCNYFRAADSQRLFIDLLEARHVIGNLGRSPFPLRNQSGDDAPAPRNLDLFALLEQVFDLAKLVPKVANRCLYNVIHCSITLLIP